MNNWRPSAKRSAGAPLHRERALRARFRRAAGGRGGWDSETVSARTSQSIFHSFSVVRFRHYTLQSSADCIQRLLQEAFRLGLAH